MATRVDVDLTEPSLYRGGVPHDVFAELRAAGGVHRHREVQLRDDLPPTAFWSVVRHAEIQHANRDWESFSAVDGPGVQFGNPVTRGHTLTSMDPPDHTHLRRLITSGFTPRMIAKLEEHIAHRTARILEAAASTGTCDFVQDVAYQLPMHVIADIVGIPDEDRPWVFERTDLMLRALDPTNSLTTDDNHAVQAELFEYAHRLTSAKRAEPADDVWTLLAGAIEGIELEMFFVILALAGSETTRNAISQGLLALLDHPDQLAALRDDPELLGPAAEELIRWASPVLYFGRTVTRDVELGGVSMAAGDRVVLWYPSGNRDERVFQDPFRFDIRRDPNPHVSFGGGGPHYCLGANLAKKEVQVLMGALVAGYDVEVTGPPAWAGAGPVHNVGVSIDHLPVRLAPRG